MIINSNINTAGYTFYNRKSNLQTTSFGIKMPDNKAKQSLIYEGTNLLVAAVASTLADKSFIKTYLGFKVLRDTVGTIVYSFNAEGNFNLTRKFIKVNTPTNIHRPILAIIDKTIDKLVPKKKF